ncbi:unnamed protein product, partial [Discosporangium mesarthrocarpum]
ALAAFTEDRPPVRVCELMAEIEQGEFGDRGRAREWLARAVRAPRDPAWVADGQVSKVWLPVSPVTGELDAFAWTVPLDALAHAEDDTPIAPTDISDEPDTEEDVAEVKTIEVTDGDFEADTKEAAKDAETEAEPEEEAKAKAEAEVESEAEADTEPDGTEKTVPQDDPDETTKAFDSEDAPSANGAETKDQTAKADKGDTDPVDMHRPDDPGPRE